MIKGWLIAGGIGLVLAAGVAVQTARLDAAHTRLEAETKRANDNAAVVERMEIDAVINAAIIASYAAEAARREEIERELRNAIARAPVTTACRDAPAMRSLLDGVRRERAASPDGRPPPAR